MIVKPEILTENINSKRKSKSFFWNMMGGGISSSQSIIILFFASRFLENESVGIFTIGYAIAVLACTVAKFGTRTYQVTDVKEKYNRKEYVFARIVSVIATLLIVLIYVLFMCLSENYSIEKGLIILFICCWKFVEAFDDVFVGIYQQIHRLYIGSFIFFVRMFISTALYCLFIVISRSLIISTVVTTIASCILSAVFWERGNKNNGIKIFSCKKMKILALLTECYPLFIASSINIFVGNEPKYLVDALLNDVAQAYLGYLIVPAYVIGLLSGFAYQPLLRDYGELWEEGQYKKLERKIYKQLGFTVIVVFLMCFLGMMIGIPVLSWLYAVDLYGFKSEFLILLLGGGAFALTTFMMSILSTIREQRFIAAIYALAAVTSLLIGRVLLIKYDVMGAAITFFLVNTTLFTLFLLKTIRRLRKNK